MKKEIIKTPNAPAAIGPYSQAVKAGGMLYCSGQIALDPKTGEFAGNDITSQTEQVMKNISAILEEAGCTFSDVVKCHIFLATMGDFAVVNEIYGRYFTENPPARETVAVKTLPKNALVEISCIAIAD